MKLNTIARIATAVILSLSALTLTAVGASADCGSAEENGHPHDPQPYLPPYFAP